MTVAIVVPGGVDASGIDRVIPCLLWLIERLARRHTVHVFALSQELRPATWTLLGARVHNIGRVAGGRRRFLATVAAVHAETPFDVIHAFWAGPGLYAAVAGCRHRVPVLTHCAGGEFVAVPEGRYGARLTWRGRTSVRLALAAAQRVTVATEYMSRQARAHGIETELVPLGVATDRWPPRAPRPRDGTHPARLLHIGDLRPVKDQTTLLNAAAQLHAAGVGFELHMVGVDHMDGGMQRLAAQLGVAGQTTWHGTLDRGRLRTLVDASDVLLMSSRHEAGPVAVLEAAVAGVPTVGTAVGHIADWAPVAAVAVPIGDAAALARAAEALLGDETRRLAVAGEALRRATLHDADFTAARFESLYEEVAARHG
jgi:glycosyltransferase involved in cell wall biosynthesis